MLPVLRAERSFDELAHRISSAFGKTRTGNRIAEATRRAVGSARQRDANLRQVGDFVLTAEQDETPPIRDRRAETGALLKVDYLPPMEIAAAAHRVRSECGTMPPEEMTRAVSRLLGFQRVGPDLSKAILAVVMQE